MPRRKKFAVWLSLTALRDAVEAMQEYVTALHERARKRERGEVKYEATRQDADRMAASERELHDALEQVHEIGRGKKP